MPFETFNMPDLGVVPWKLVVLLLSILVVRRIPCLLLLYRFVPEITSWKEALFSGHFGASAPDPPFLLILIHAARTCKFSL
jgi:sodium/hydrogen antiporter